MIWKIFFTFALSCDFVHQTFASDGEAWNYEDHGPFLWSQTYPECAGRQQSPIDLGYFNVTPRKFPSFWFSPHFNSYLPFTLKNNGHTVVGELAAQVHPTSILQLSGGDLPGIFTFTNFHLHWGSSPTVGSEHTINGLHGAGEAHFVFTNLMTKQVAVLGFFIVVSPDQEQTAWRSYVDNAVTLIREGTHFNFMASLMKLMETENNFQDFWRYNGSLTTPPCTEGVIWTIFNSHIKFSNDELSALSLNVLHKDFRPPQPTYNRIVYHSTLTSAVDSLRCFFSWLMLVSMFFLIRLNSKM
ncbi:unnamed protein product [Rotaria socialis]|uniref:carbonic anhydrase n=1 Tax=Rotaria socialis TaxID=392032 RepID=A0A817YJX7_9BILA|nr:unnamed protein product [Rotaria socialis]